MGRGGTPDLICDLNHPLHILATGSLLAGAWCWWRVQLQTTAELLALGWLVKTRQGLTPRRVWGARGADAQSMAASTAL